MAKLPRPSGREVIRVFEKLGYAIDRQKGSHIILKSAKECRSITVPDHKALAPGTFLAIIKQSGRTKNEFLALL